MKNPVRFSNRKEQTIFIYHVYDNSFLQLATLSRGETTVMNIPRGSHIAIKKGVTVEDMIVPIETIFETYLDKNFFFL
jgi:hypothetical protein|tara:strand:+ start:1198 stop:1431 length:234 start_codon:yes stop_codon:yes gene_type:complete